MDGPAEKVYVAVGSDAQDGFKTLEWTLKKWKSSPISIVILHVIHKVQIEYVHTPFGKLPARYVSEEKLEDIRKCEQEKIDKLLSSYVSFCGKVHAEIHKVEKIDEPIHRTVIDLISGLKITKLVLDFSFMKQSWKARGAISGSFYVHQHKPDFCELFIICGGKQVYLKGNQDQKIIEDDNGVMIGKEREKVTFKDWIEKMLMDNMTNISDKSFRQSRSSKNLGSSTTQDQWEFNLEEIEKYFQELFSSTSSLDQDIPDKKKDILQIDQPGIPKENNSNMTDAEKVENLKSKLSAAENIIQLKKEDTKANLDRQSKAEWAICLCNRRAEEIEAGLKEEVNNREDLSKALDLEKELLNEITSDVEESKKRLNALLDFQSQLSNKLHMSTLAKSHAESQLEKAVTTRSEMLREIEELRKFRDVLRRRIEFCKEKDAIGTVARQNEVSFAFREYSLEEIRLATDDFSERVRLKSRGDWTNVYRGRISHTSLAIKMLNAPNLSNQDFLTKVKLISSIRQPHLVAIMGFCAQLKCIVYEYMHYGSLQDLLFSYPKRRNRTLKWHDRIRIATEVCSGLAFLHLARPKPLVHGSLSSSNILLDRNLVAKIGSFGFSPNYSQGDLRTDIHALGILMLQLLTGRNWAGLVETAAMTDKEAVIKALDEMAGRWPLDLVEEFLGLALRCMSIKNEANIELNIECVAKDLNELKSKSDKLVGRHGRFVSKQADSQDVPNVFLCPIFQEVMKNPYIAADGFSYELEAIEEWIQTGHDTSPVTNSRLNHTFLTPNHTLRSLIEDWQTKRSNSTDSRQ